MKQGLWMNVRSDWKKEESGFSSKTFVKKCNPACRVIVVHKDTLGCCRMIKSLFAMSRARFVALCYHNNKKRAQYYKENNVN